MKKKIIGVIFSLLVSANLLANTLLDQMRANQVNDYLSNLDSIYNYSTNYLLSSGDLTPTSSELSSSYSLPSNFFSNFDNSSNISFSLDLVSKTFIITNTLGSSPNQFVVSSFLNSSSSNRITSSSNNYSVSYSLDSSLSNFISLVQKINSNSNIIISQSQPSDTTKTWYQPNNNGSFKVLDFINSSWSVVGSSDPSSTIIQVQTLADLNSISCLSNDSAFIVSATSAESYICNSNIWSKITTGSQDAFNGDASILELATTLISYPGNSIGRSTDPYPIPSIKNVFSGNKTFIKRDSTGTNGYWIDDTNNIIVGGNIADISSRNWTNGMFAYIPNSTNTKVILLQKINNQWMIIADGYNDVVTIDITSQIVFDKKNNKYFRFLNNYWYDTTISGTNINSIYLTSNSSGRSTFPAPSNVSVKYLTLTNDCLSSSCNGLVGSNYFAGEQLDSMYVYYYSTSGKRENNLIDAIPSVSITDTYNRGLLAGLVGNTVYIKALDTLNRTCYQSVVNNGYYTKVGKLIPTGNNLPSSVDCSTATYTTWYGNSDFLVLNTRTDATNWTTAPNNAYIYLNANASGYAHVLSGSIDFWTTDGSGDGQINASEIFTGGSRTSFPVVTHSINALTKLVDTPNYLGGLTSSIDNSFKQWSFLNGYGVKNLIDIPIVSSYANIYNNGSSYVLYNGNIFQKLTDTLGRVCYRNNTDMQYYTKTGYWIPTGNNLPSSVDCSNAIYTSTYYLNLGTRTDATNWTTSPHGAGVYLTSVGAGYMKVKSGTMDFYTNNGNGDYQQYASEIFTGGTRANFPIVTHDINALSKGVDTPNNVGGMNSWVDGTFKQWYYTPSDINRVQNLIDRHIIINAGSTRTWSDGTYAKSCNDYLNNSLTKYYYYGATGTGIYRIDPDGNGGVGWVDVYCDQTTYGGGWTLVFRDSSNDTLHQFANYMARSTTSYGSITGNVKYKINSVPIVHSQLLFKGTISNPATYYTSGYAVVNGTLDTVTGWNDGSCGPGQFYNSGCDMYARTLNYYSYVGGAFASSDYWFGDTHDLDAIPGGVADYKLWTQWGAPYRNIWHTQQIIDDTHLKVGTNPTTITREIFLK